MFNKYIFFFKNNSQPEQEKNEENKQIRKYESQYSQPDSQSGESYLDEKEKKIQ